MEYYLKKLSKINMRVSRAEKHEKEPAFCYYSGIGELFEKFVRKEGEKLPGELAIIALMFPTDPAVELRRDDE
ncbi:MAG TPA: hypothetical protein DCZ93_02095 [Elusimicrobia bacterium]|nr:hypothetical protein [Elusimicrobiota bacterium]